MNTFARIIAACRPITDASLHLRGVEPCLFAATDPQELTLDVEAGARAQVVVVHTVAGTTTLQITVAEGAQLELTEIFTAEAFSTVAVRQATHSLCQLTVVQFMSANGNYRVDLDGADAESAVNGLFLASGEEHCTLHLHTQHNVADCRSASLVKGVAGGCAVGEFCGRVYVAQDAQHTDAQQQSRNILLGDTARIITRPQLEIYADDVKCSHGATVGQMDTDAILYMRQRGFSAEQARRVQIEGFAGDVVRRCGNEELVEALMEAVETKLETL